MNFSPVAMELNSRIFCRRQRKSIVEGFHSSQYDSREFHEMEFDRDDWKLLDDVRFPRWIDGNILLLAIWLCRCSEIIFTDEIQVISTE